MESLNNLKRILADGYFKQQKVKVVQVPTVEGAEKLNFQGSPTILVNGIDIYSEKKPDSYNYSCRVFVINKHKTGVLTNDFIKKQLEKFF